MDLRRGGHRAVARSHDRAPWAAAADRGAFPSILLSFGTKPSLESVEGASHLVSRRCGTRGAPTSADRPTPNAPDSRPEPRLLGPLSSRPHGSNPHASLQPRVRGAAERDAARGAPKSGAGNRRAVHRVGAALCARRAPAPPRLRKRSPAPERYLNQELTPAEQAPSRPGAAPDATEG